jgi:hypothetical protein
MTILINRNFVKDKKKDKKRKNKADPGMFSKG